MSSPSRSLMAAAGKKRSISPPVLAPAPVAAFYSTTSSSPANTAKRPKVAGASAQQEAESSANVQQQQHGEGKEEDGHAVDSSTSNPAAVSASNLAPPLPSSHRRGMQTAESFDDLDGGEVETAAMIAAAEAAENLNGRTSAKVNQGDGVNQAATSTLSLSSSSGRTHLVPAKEDLLSLERSTMDPLWFSRLEAEMHKPSFRSLKNFLEAEKKQKQTVYPPEKLIHNWSRLTPLDKVKVVVVGQDPYHGPGQACGMSFSVPKGVPVPGSLKNIYKELSDEYPGSFQAPKHGNLETWASQGVLLLNASLTVRGGQAASHHGKGWEPFTRAILELVKQEALTGTGSQGASRPTGPSTVTQSNKLMGMFKKQGVKIEESSVSSKSKDQAEAVTKKTSPTTSAAETLNGSPTSSHYSSSSSSTQVAQRKSKGVVFLAWGLPAAKTLAEAGITEKTSPSILVLKSPHPSPLSAHRGFLGNGHFKKANEWLEEQQRYGPGGGIRWQDV